VWQKSGFFALPTLVAMAIALSGCGGVRPVPGGTKGTLRAGGQALSDIQVTVHQLDPDGMHPVGFGVTGPDGSFELVSMGAKEALWLAPGEYRLTLESAGAPVQIPKEYAQPAATPLKVSWSSGQTNLELEAPAFPPSR